VNKRLSKHFAYYCDPHAAASEQLMMRGLDLCDHLRSPQR